MRNGKWKMEKPHEQDGFVNGQRQGTRNRKSETRRVGVRRRVKVRVQPKASRSEVSGADSDGTLRIRVTAPPAGGEANREVIRLLAEVFGVPKSAVVIVAGETRREKIVEIDA
jgi:uncharacterized protein (TIGR00251 family)